MDYQGEYTGPQIDERLTLAGSAYQKPETGIPTDDLSQEVQEGLIEKRMFSFGPSSEKALQIDASAAVLLHIYAVLDTHAESYLVLRNDDYGQKIYCLGKSTNNAAVEFREDSDYYKLYLLGKNETDVEITISVIAGRTPEMTLVDGSYEEYEGYDVLTPFNYYIKPAPGIPKSDLANGVQISLDNADAAAGILPLIPSAASSSNKLTDKEYVDNAIQTESATFRGEYENWNDVYEQRPSTFLGTDKNDYIIVRDASDYAPTFVIGGEYEADDYCFYDGYLYKCIAYIEEAVETPDYDTEHWESADSNPDYLGTWKFKYVPSGDTYSISNWQPEYQINEEPLTPSQTAAINSGITAEKVTKLDALPTNATLTQVLEGKANAKKVVCNDGDIVIAPGTSCAFKIDFAGTDEMNEINPIGSLYINGELSIGSVLAFYYGTALSEMITSIKIMEDEDSQTVIVIKKDQYMDFLVATIYPLVGDDVSAYVHDTTGWMEFDTITPIVLEMQSNKVTTLSSSSTNSQYPSAKAVFDAIHPASQSVEPSGGMLPNVLYNFGTLSGNTTFSINTTDVVPGVNHYYWMFDTPATAPTITWPAGITWADGAAPTISGSKHYEISLLNGVAIAMEV